MITQSIATLSLLLAPVALAAQGTPPTSPASSPRSPNLGAHVTVDLGNGSQAEFDARSFDLGISRAATKDEGPATPALHLVKRAGPFTGTFVQTSASGQHLPTLWVSVPDTAGGPAMTITLSDVVIDTDRLVLSGARAGLEQQRISQQAALTQLTADYQEAQRQLSIAEQLGKSRVTTPQDLSRAREHASELQQRLELARRSQALLETQLAAQGPMDEELTLHFARIAIDGAEPGAHGTWDFSAVASGQGTRKPRQ
ncbi:MAG TPA: hypothetical protein VF159_12365 [Gemmatimonadaceae bacterium]